MAFNLVGKAVRRVRLPIVDYNAAPITIIPVQEGDVNSRYFEISLYDDNGDVDLSFYTRAILSGETPSGITLQSQSCEIAEDGKSVIALFGGGFTAQAGRVACNISFENSKEEVMLTSQTFHVIVSESSINRIVTENEDDYNLLLSLLKKVDEIEEEVTSSENKRKEAEENRVNAEDERQEAETERTASEDSRVEAEKTRVSAENKRVSKEKERQKNEDTREANEANRATAESQRNTSEQNRIIAEDDRVISETARDAAEQERKANDLSRETAESQRAAAEEDRATAETKRAEDFQTAIDNCDTATQNANEAAQDIRDILDALPCSTNKIDGEMTTSFIALNFVAVED